MASTKGTRLPSVSDEKAAADAASSPAPPPPTRGNFRSSLSKARTQRLFDVLVAEDEDDTDPPNFDNIATTSTSIAQEGKAFIDRMMDTSHEDKQRTNRYQDFTEGRRLVLSPNISPEYLPESQRNVKIPTLRECQSAFTNPEADAHYRMEQNPFHRILTTFLNIIAAFYIWVAHTVNFETLLAITNASLVTLFYCYYSDLYAAKLDFAFLSFSVVFPLTFLIQSTFTRREDALHRLSDFRACVLSTALLTFTCDWPDPEVPGSFAGGRRRLPKAFDKAALDDFCRMMQLVYEYLSMPSVSHARHVVLWHKQPYKRRVHAKQNELLKKWNDCIFDMSMHTEEMRKAGFQSGEASRLHQYHQYLEQRFEHLRCIKYYRTPQATRSFGRVYIYILPWMTGPYFAWVFEQQFERSYGFTLTLAAFTFFVLQGLLNTQQGLEDPFLTDYTSWTPGIDAVKLDFEMAVALQAVEQYYAEAKIHAAWQEREREKKAERKQKKAGESH